MVIKKWIDFNEKFSSHDFRSDIEHLLKEGSWWEAIF